MPKLLGHRLVTAAGEALTRSQEGLRLAAYWDAVGHVWTIGYGHTGAYPTDPSWTGPKGTVESDDILTAAQADLLLDFDLTIAEAAVSRLVLVPLTDNEYDAIVDWTFNDGVEALAKSTLLHELNAGNYSDVPAQMARWDEADGKVCATLVRRRTAEAKLWES